MAKRNLSKDRIISTRSVIQNLNTELVNSSNSNDINIKRYDSIIWNDFRENNSTVFTQSINLKNGAYPLSVRNTAGEHLATHLLLNFMGFSSTAALQMCVPPSNDVQFRVVTDRVLYNWVYLVTSSNIYNYTNSLEDFNSLKKDVENLKSQQASTLEMKDKIQVGGEQLTYSLPISYNYLNIINRKEWLQHEA